MFIYSIIHSRSLLIMVFLDFRFQRFSLVFVINFLREIIYRVEKIIEIITFGLDKYIYFKIQQSTKLLPIILWKSIIFS